MSPWCSSSRQGLTVIEVLMALGIFLLGSVSIVGLFVTASVLHADAVNRRTASFIGEELLARVRTMRLRDVFATTELVNDGGAQVDVAAVAADRENQGANFDEYPFFPWPFEQEPAAQSRLVGPILIDQELIWYMGLNATPAFTGCDRTFPGGGASHAAEADILQPRTWYFLVADQDPAAAGLQALPEPPASAPSDTQVLVYGDPAGGALEVPTAGYIVLGEEWIRYTGTNPGEFSWDDEEASRGVGETEAVSHPVGTPVSVAYEHPRYPGFYCSVQFYPSNTTGSQARVLIGVGYGTPERFRVHAFHTVFTPSIF